MLGAGQIQYYLVKWKKIEQVPESGLWEAYNAMITAFWHNDTKKEGERIGRLDQR